MSQDTPLPHTPNGNQPFPSGWGELFHKPGGSEAYPLTITDNEEIEELVRLANKTVRPIVIIDKSRSEERYHSISVSLGTVYSQFTPDGVQELTTTLDSYYESCNIFAMRLAGFPGPGLPYESFVYLLDTEPESEFIKKKFNTIVADVSNWGRYTSPVIENSVESYPKAIPSVAPQIDSPPLRMYPDSPYPKLPKDIDTNLSDSLMIQPNKLLNLPVVPTGYIALDELSPVTNNTIEPLIEDFLELLSTIQLLSELPHNVTTNDIIEHSSINNPTCQVERLLTILEEYDYIEKYEQNEWRFRSKNIKWD